MTRIPLMLLAFMAVASSVSAESAVSIKTGLGTGEAYLNMSSREQRAYAIGVVNGMLLAPLFGAPKEKMLRIESCLVGMTDTQVAAILTKYLRENPGRWHETPHVPMYAALIETCPK